MITDALDCVIKRRLLVNYRIEPDLVAAQVPKPLRPQLINGCAVGGVCFLSLAQLRPSGLPAQVGIAAENVAHRYAVEWDDADGTHTGVYVPRRDTASRVATWAGGSIFPGRYHLSHFEVVERGLDVRIKVASRDGTVQLSVAAREAQALGGKLFGSLCEATDFFKTGALGYSPGPSGHLEEVRLVSQDWDTKAVSVLDMRSSLFDDVKVFPPGTCELDSGLVMHNLSARWATERATSRSRR